MNTPMTAEEIDKLARKRAGAKLGWFIHATVFFVVNLGLFLMSDFGFGQRRWSVFPLVGWGIGLALHGISVWLLGAGSQLRERLVASERERIEQAARQRRGGG